MYHMCNKSPYCRSYTNKQEDHHANKLFLDPSTGLIDRAELPLAQFLYKL